MLSIHELRSDAGIAAAFPLMASLRDRIHADTFLGEVRRQQEQGYQLIGAFDGTTLVALAGVRRSHTLSRGEHVFVDDLVTDERMRGAGHGRTLVRWIAERAAADGIERIYLDSRLTAKGFYAGLGFTFHTSIPCWLDVRKFLAEASGVL
jgi:GNAT superfamily N-acetyltransferase